MNKYFILFIAAATLVLAGCMTSPAEGDKSAIDNSVKAPGDSTLYGLACDGTSDSTIVFLPNEGGDPDTLSILPAVRAGRVFGTPEIGDAVALMVSPKNKREVLELIDLDELKGTWTYQVMPSIRPSKTKTEAEIEAELTDSMRALLFVPREYGFSLRSHNKVYSVGYVFKSTTLSDESIVEYPPVPSYTQWDIFCGRLVLAKDTVDNMRRPIPKNKVEHDTLTFLYMKDDSLALAKGGYVVGFRRQKDIQSANEKAQKAATKTSKADSIKL